MSGRIEMGDKFTCSLSDAGELVMLIQDFSLADVGEYKVIVENELGDVSQIIRMEMSGNSAVSILSCCRQSSNYNNYLFIIMFRTIT